MGKLMIVSDLLHCLHWCLITVKLYDIVIANVGLCIYVQLESPRSWKLRSTICRWSTNIHHWISESHLCINIYNYLSICWSTSWKQMSHICNSLWMDRSLSISTVWIRSVACYWNKVCMVPLMQLKTSVRQTFKLSHYDVVTPDKRRHYLFML